MAFRNRFGLRMAGVVLATMLALPVVSTAADTWANFAELTSVREDTVRIGKETFRPDPGLVILDANGIPMTWDDLTEHEGASVLFSAKYGHPTPWVVRIAVQKPDED